LSSMSIIERIDKDTVTALKGGDKERVVVLRGLKSDLKYKMISLGREKEFDDQMAAEVLSGAAKKRRESIEQFQAGNRDDLVRNMQFELAIIESYLPEQMSEEKLRELIAAAISESGADSPQKLGLVMKVLMPQVKGKADGKLVNRLVSEMLAK
jgi:uncharacterized protein YqeY